MPNAELFGRLLSAGVYHAEPEPEGPPSSGECPMFTSVGNYMCTFIGQNLCVCGFDASASWQSVDALQAGYFPVAMQGFEGPSVIVLDNINGLWICSIPRGSFTDRIAQAPSELQIREFMGAGLAFDNQTWCLAAVDTQNRGWLVGNPTGGGNWVPLPRLNPPHGAREGKKVRSRERHVKVAKRPIKPHRPKTKSKKAKVQRKTK
jgi:hypothetical protein